MNDDDIELFHSPLTQTHSAEGHTLRIEIYRGANEPWILEIVDELGTSTVWGAEFESDQAALDASFAAIKAEGGVHAFVIQAQQKARDAEPELLRKLAHVKRSLVSAKVGRNEPCPCGSGKKFKKCCGAPSELH